MTQHTPTIPDTCRKVRHGLTRAGGPFCGEEATVTAISAADPGLAYSYCSDCAPASDDVYPRGYWRVYPIGRAPSGQRHQVALDVLDDIVRACDAEVERLSEVGPIPQSHGDAERVAQLFQDAEAGERMMQIIRTRMDGMAASA